MDDLQKKLANLSPQQRAAVLKKLQAKQAKTAEQAAIEIIDRSQPLPLSFAQERLWFIDQYEQDSATYNMPATLQLDGILNIDILQQAITHIVQRHEVLRTRFLTEAGIARQEIINIDKIDIPIEDLQNLSKTAQNDKISQLANTEAAKAFNLATDIPLRMTLLKCTPQQHILLITLHHIAADGWSVGILIKELSTLYQAFLNQRPNPLPNLKIQYADFAHWQRRQLSGNKLEELISYWKQKLVNAPALLELPLDKPRPAQQTFNGNRILFEIDTKTTQKLLDFTKQQETTLFVSLLAIFSILLNRYTQQNDIIVGSPIANRTSSEIEPLIGFFVNTLVLRAEIKENQSFIQLVQQLKQTSLEAFQHQALPFEKLIEELKIERNLSYPPLFQVMFGVQNMPQYDFDLPELKVSFLENQRATAKFDLSLLMEQTQDKITAEVEYNTDLFIPQSIERLIGHFKILLDSALSQPTINIAQLDLLTPKEKQQFIEWNQTEKDYPQQCVHQLFEQQVEKTPNNIAVVFEQESLTYQQLNEKANQLAHYLQKIIVKKETFIGICVERSLEMMIGLLGIIKAGAAYVPLDPTYPKERLAFMLQDANAPVLLTQQHLLTVLPQNQAQLIYLDSEWSKIAKNPINNLNLNIQLKNLTYVIYTSGSTGKPKGAMNTHLAVSNRLLWMQDRYQLTVKDVILQKTPFSFDVSVWEFFWPILAGARLTFARPEGHKDPEYLAEWIEQQQVTTLHFVPSMLQAFLLNAPIKKYQSLRQIFCSGEALSVELQNHFFECFPNIQLHNLYGPTEAAVDVTYWTCQANETRNTVPIGKPISNIQIYILDKQLRFVPIGVAGELHIGGIGVARGYHHRPELTAEKFIPNHFTQQGQLYKTGDLARYLPSGDIEYLGRIDQQVKIRGFRIELGEIESILSNYPNIQASCVIIREDQANNKAIVAYFIAQETIQLDDLRAFMQQTLPDYMLPKTFIQLEKFPLTPNGKIDHKALPAPESNKRTNEQDFIEPKTEIEQALAKIWSEVLNIEKISINDNFFVLGGDSILSIQVVARANQQQIKLTPRLIFQYQTIAQLASMADITQATQAQQDLVTGEIPLTPIQHWFFAQNLANPHYYNQSILLNLANDIQPNLLEKAIQYLLIHHDVLRLQFQKVDGKWQQHNLAETNAFKLKIVNLQNDAQILTETQAAQSSLNIETAQLINAIFFKKTQTVYLFITIHHLAVDGVSWRILLEDLATIYQQLSQQQKLQLPAKTTAFQDWSRYLQKYAMQSEQYADFWLQQSTSMLIPIDFKAQQTANIIQSSADISLSLSAEQTTDLLQNISQAYNTQINDILLTALTLTLSEWTGQTAILLDLEAHGRESINDELDLSRTVGWFTSLYPVVLQTSQSPDLGESIKQVKEQLRKIPNNGFDYAILRYLSQNSEIRQQLQDLPSAQISFNYLGQFEQGVQNNLFLGVATEKTANYHTKENQRAYLLDFNLIILNKQLKINCTYSQAFYRSETIEQLMQNYITHLQNLIEHCLHPQTGGYTPSDFPEANLNQDDLDNLLDQL